MQTIALNGEWAVAPTALTVSGEAGCTEVAGTQQEWLPAQVPGEIHLDLMRAGRMDDPAISDTSRQSRWPEEHAWWYRTTFEVAEEFLAHERQVLLAEGLDCDAQVFVNGRLVGTARNAFIAHQFDVRTVLQVGQNTLLIRLTAGTELVKDREHLFDWSSEEVYAVRNFTMQRYLRKPQYQYGWDWNDPLPNIGIWRGIRLEGRSGVIIQDLRLDTMLQNGKVTLSGQAVLENLHPWIERLCACEVEITAPDGEEVCFYIEASLPMGRSGIPIAIDIPNPQLWWPNGMGEQPLYTVTARLCYDDKVCDVLQRSIGLRTVEIDRAVLFDGSRFCMRVNGQEVFCKGGNWAPPDMIPARVTPERYEALVAEAKNAHFTMFRVNGVGYYPDEVFYDACDRAGILLWQDFTFACMSYPDHEPEFRAAVAAEADTLVRQLRHHPSLALWCGCNESIWLNSHGKDPYSLGGIHIFGKILPDTCRTLDPHRPYWPCSPFGGEEPNSETAGNCHWWGPYMDADLSKRTNLDIADTCRARFVSEYGIIGPPHLDSVQQYLKPEEQRRESRAWQIHTNRFEIGSVAEGIRAHYGDPDGLSLEEFILYGQLYQAMAHGHAMEAMRFRKDDFDAECWGALIWSYNDCWGEVGWSVIDHYLRRKAGYYWLRRACAPVKVLVRPREEQIVTRIVNDTLQSFSAELQYGWFRLDGMQRLLTTKEVTIPANGMLEVTRETMPGSVDPREWLYGAVLQGDGWSDQAIRLLAPIRELSLPEPHFTVTAQGEMLEITSPVFCHAVHCDDGGYKVLSDNYFDLLPGIPRQVSGKVPAEGLKAVQRVSGTDTAITATEEV